MVDATRELILNCEDIELVKVTVPGWNDKDGNPIDVYIKQMSGKDAEDYLAQTNDKGNVNERYGIKVLVVSLCNKEGIRLFTTDHIEALLAKNSRIITWLREKILEINFSAINDIDEQAKN